VQEIDLLLSSSVPSPLMAALPFVFITEDLHAISANLIQQGQQPPNIQITKYFFKPHIEDIKKEFFQVKAMGTGTAEEWFKGLDNTGREKRNDASRWEKWEAAGGLLRMRENDYHEQRESNNASQIASPKQTQANLEKSMPLNLPATLQVNRNEGLPSNGISSHPLPQLVTAYGKLKSFEALIDMTLIQFKNAAINAAPRFDSPSQNSFGPYPNRTFQGTRQERSKEEVSEMKAARKTEIERRCMLLKPPLTPGVLAHMGSFQAAIQIITPFDDNAWDLLLPRLLLQRDEAEQREADRLKHTRVAQEKVDERKQQDLQLKESKDMVDREWEDNQAPVRVRISGFADEIIHEAWGDGIRVTRESSPRFAAEVLIYVRKRFYAEVGKDDAVAQANGQYPVMEPPPGLPARKLILENMKWVYDMKIKPHTEQYRKELFLCSLCENNVKLYGFEGIIQHYAAKHTSALSVGSIVVHWRAEWPEQPPFDPSPIVLKGSHHSKTLPSTTAYPSTAPAPQVPGFGGYPSVSGQASVQVSGANVSGYPQAVGPYYAPPNQYGEQYPGHTVVSNQAFQGQPYQGIPSSGYPQYQGQGYAFQGYDAAYTGAPVPTYEYAQPVQVPAVTVADSMGPHYPNESGQLYQQGQLDPGSTFNTGGQPIANFRSEEYKTQLLDVARSARDVWNSTTGVKDMPGSVRVYVILYHVLQNFREKYSDDPPLSMIIDGLSNNKDMRPVRNINGLACRACILEKAARGTHSFPRPSKAILAVEKKLYSFPQLLNHFQAMHTGGAAGSVYYDWTSNMVELAEKKKISALAQNPAIDDFKMQLISEAIPHAFVITPPPPDHSLPESSYSQYHETPASQDYSELAPSQDNHEKYYTSKQEDEQPAITDYEPADYNQYYLRGEKSKAGVDSTAGLLQHDNKKSAGDADPKEYVVVKRVARSPERQSKTYFESSQVAKTDTSSRHNELIPDYQEHQSVASRSRGPRGVVQIPNPDHGYADEALPLNPIHMKDRQTSDKGRTTSRNTEVHYPGPSILRHENRSPQAVSASVAFSQVQNYLQNDATTSAWSEDGELRGQPVSKPEVQKSDVHVSAETAAERFLNEFMPGDTAESYAKKAEEAARRDEEALRATWENERVESMQRMYQPPLEQKPQVIRVPREEHLPSAGSMYRQSQPRPTSNLNDQMTYDMAPAEQRQYITYEYEDRFGNLVSEQQSARLRQADALNTRYEGSNLAYLDDDHGGHSSQVMPTRYARYESVRQGNDRPRSRSPIYVNVGGVQSRYRELSPVPRYAQQEPIYRTRTPQAPVDDVAYERVPRQEYYRVYEDEPRRRQPQYDEQIQYVQISDPQGDYVVRRPVRRDIDPVYARYEEEPYPRQVIYETRAPVSRSDPAYYEEYDPRNPAPPPTTTIRQVRYE
jgi:hypothetical protein